MIGHDKHERLLNALTKSLMIFFILLSFGNVSSNVHLNTTKKVLKKVSDIPEYKKRCWINDKKVITYFCNWLSHKIFGRKRISFLPFMHLKHAKVLSPLLDFKTKRKVSWLPPPFTPFDVYWSYCFIQIADQSLDFSCKSFRNPLKRVPICFCLTKGGCLKYSMPDNG